MKGFAALALLCIVVALCLWPISPLRFGLLALLGALFGAVAFVEHLLSEFEETGEEFYD